MIQLSVVMSLKLREMENRKCMANLRKACDFAVFNWIAEARSNRVVKRCVNAHRQFG